MDKTDDTLIKIGGEIIIVLVCICTMIGFHVKEDHSASQLQASESSANRAENFYNNKQASLLNSVEVNAYKSKNPILRAYGINRNQFATVNSSINLFLKGIYNWDNEYQYNQRANQVRSVVTPNVLRNGSVFSSDKDKTGGSIIKALGLHNTYNNSVISVVGQNSNTVTCLVSANYKAWEDNQIAHTAEQDFLMKVNRNTHKITKVKKLYTNVHI